MGTGLVGALACRRVYARGPAPTQATVVNRGSHICREVLSYDFLSQPHCHRVVARAVCARRPPPTFRGFRPFSVRPFSSSVCVTWISRVPVPGWHGVLFVTESWSVGCEWCC